MQYPKASKENITSSNQSTATKNRINHFNYPECVTTTNITITRNIINIYQSNNRTDTNHCNIIKNITTLQKQTNTTASTTADDDRMDMLFHERDQNIDL